MRSIPLFILGAWLLGCASTRATPAASTGATVATGASGLEPNEAVLDEQVREGVRLLANGSEDAVFEQLGGEPGHAGDVLLALETRGGKVREGFARYLARHAEGGLFASHDAQWSAESPGFYRAVHVGAWLLSRGHFEFCAPLATAAERSGASIELGFLPYFSAARCSEGLRVAASALSDARDPKDRLSACLWLDAHAGRGDRFALIALHDAADRDPHRLAIGKTDVYPVREACSAALRHAEQRHTFARAD